MNGRRNFARTGDYLLIAAFGAILWIPLAGSFLGAGNTEGLGEKRRLAEPPVLGRDPLTAMPDKFEAYYRDHFGFRNGLIRGHNWIRYKLFKGQSFGKVLFGKDDWLFLTKSEILADYLGHGLLDQARLAAWRKTFEQRHGTAQDNSADYLILIAPNKAGIYPEKLPDHIAVRRGRTRFDQLLENMAGSPVQLLDIRGALKESKSQGLVYHPQDTHWNDRGAFVAYRSICSRLKSRMPWVAPRRISDFTVAADQWQGDLAEMLGLGKQLRMEYERFVPLRTRRASFAASAQSADYAWPGGECLGEIAVAANPEGRGRALIFVDSFGARGQFRELLAEHFARTVFVSANPSNRNLALMIQAEKPDVVIEEIVERKLKDPPEEVFSEEQQDF